MLHGGSAAACVLPNGPRVRSMPQGGCSAFEREPGADDGDAPPLPLSSAPLQVAHQRRQLPQHELPVRRHAGQVVGGR